MASANRSGLLRSGLLQEAPERDCLYRKFVFAAPVLRKSRLGEYGTKSPYPHTTVHKHACKKGAGKFLYGHGMPLVFQKLCAAINAVPAMDS